MIDTESTTVPTKLIQTHQYLHNTEKADMLANRGIDNLKTARLDTKVDGITKSMDVFFVDLDTTYILLSRDQLSVKAWVTHNPVTVADEVPIPLAAITKRGAGGREKCIITKQILGMARNQAAASFKA